MSIAQTLVSRFRRRGTDLVDTSFYGSYYVDLRQHDTKALLLHYLRHGKQEGRHPSLSALRQAVAASGVVLPKDFDPHLYLRLNQDLEGLDETWQIEMHYLDKGVKEGRRYKRSLEDIADEAIGLREKGDLAASAKITEWLCETHPEVPYGWREMAELSQAAGDKVGALRCLERALEAEISILSVSQLVRHMCSMGLVAEARKHIARFEPPTTNDKKEIEILHQLVMFILDYPIERARQMIRDIVDTPRFLEADAIENFIAKALARGTAFSLIRVGDGEGAWLTDLDEDGRRYFALYQRNRRAILRTWFGSDALVERPDFVALTSRLKDAIAGATIVGIPYPERIEWEYGIMSLDGVPSCVTVMRHAMSLAVEPARLFCSHDAHFNLQLSGALERLLKLRCRVGLICCHPGLAMRLHEMYGVEIVANLCLPEEKGMSKIIGSTDSRLAHFPNVFERNVARIRASDWTSTIWLIAAGYLGKIYCNEIKQRGGIAIDIGSLADGWMGKKTRPTLAKEILSYELATDAAVRSA